MGEIFEQADNRITREHGGIGLGLSLSKRIVEMMKGRMSVELEPGKDSCFICDICFDIGEAETGMKSDKPAVNAVNVSTALDLAGRWILIDDHLSKPIDMEASTRR